VAHEDPADLGIATSAGEPATHGPGPLHRARPTAGRHRDLDENEYGHGGHERDREGDGGERGLALVVADAAVDHLEGGSAGGTGDQGAQRAEPEAEQPTRADRDAGEEDADGDDDGERRDEPVGGLFDGGCGGGGLLQRLGRHGGGSSRRKRVTAGRIRLTGRVGRW
jgi:hypothetical protein